MIVNCLSEYKSRQFPHTLSDTTANVKWAMGHLTLRFCVLLTCGGRVFECNVKWNNGCLFPMDDKLLD